MSRRTKLLILALFLVLLVIPVIYLGCTWSTDNPLRFQAIRLEVDRSPQAAPGIGTLHITVRNISKLPVHLELAVLSKVERGTGNGTIIGAILPSLQDRPQKSPTPLYLPPGESMQCFAYVSTDVDSPHVLEDIQIDYHWRSEMADNVHDLWVLCLYDAPAGLRDRIPAPKSSQHRTPLGPLPSITASNPP